MSNRVKRRCALRINLGLMTVLGVATGQSVLISPSRIDFSGSADSLDLMFPKAISVGVPPGGANVGFGFVDAVPVKSGGPDFVVVSPARGMTPASVYVGLNPNVVPYLPPGGYGEIIQFNAGAPGSNPVAVEVTLTLVPSPTPSIGSVVSAATFQPVISPGEIVSVFGTNLGTPSVSAQYNNAGLYPTTLGNTVVTFGGVAAPLLYVETRQINAVVPYELAGQQTVEVVVTHDQQPSPAFILSIADTSPGIFTTTESGSGQGAILNADPANPNILTANTISNPATRGSTVVIFATGAGLWNSSVQDGSIILAPIVPPVAPAATVSLTIGGEAAKILYAGATLYHVSGTLQINAVIPDGTASGPQPAVLTIGQNSNSQQQVTVAIQ